MLGIAVDCISTASPRIAAVLLIESCLRWRDGQFSEPFQGNRYHRSYERLLHTLWLPTSGPGVLGTHRRRGYTARKLKHLRRVLGNRGTRSKTPCSSRLKWRPACFHRGTHLFLSAPSPDEKCDEPIRSNYFEVRLVQPNRKKFFPTPKVVSTCVTYHTTSSALCSNQSAGRSRVDNIRWSDRPFAITTTQ
jgi:hypothetical protein